LHFNRFSNDLIGKSGLETRLFLLFRFLSYLKNFFFAKMSHGGPQKLSEKVSRKLKSLGNIDSHNSSENVQV